MHIVLYLGKGLIGGKGGTEKVMLTLANQFSQRGHQVTMVTNEAIQGELLVELLPAVTLLNIGGQPVRTLQRWRYKLLDSNPLTRRYLYRHLLWHPWYCTSSQVRKTLLTLQPDILLAASPADVLELGFQQPPYPFPIIQMLHCEPAINFQRKSRKTFHATLAVVQQHVQVVQTLQSKFIPVVQQYYTGEIAVIANSITPIAPDQQLTYHAVKDTFTIVYFARLCRGKQQDLLLHAWSLLASDYPQWQLHLWGSGKTKDVAYLHKLIQHLNLTSSAKLCGFTATPTAELLQADICAFPSRSEGFPLALGEAMAVGLPCVAIEGVTNLITHQHNGLLCKNDPMDLALNLHLLLADASLRERLGTAAKSSMQAYAPAQIIQQWEQLMTKTINKFKGLADA